MVQIWPSLISPNKKRLVETSRFLFVISVHFRYHFSVPENDHLKLKKQIFRSQVSTKLSFPPHGHSFQIWLWPQSSNTSEQTLSSRQSLSKPVCWYSACLQTKVHSTIFISNDSTHRKSPFRFAYSHSLRSTFPRFLFPLGYGGLKRVFASKFVFFSVFPQFSKLWVSNWYHSLVSFRLKNRLGKSDYSFQKSDTWTGIH